MKYIENIIHSFGYCLMKVIIFFRNDKNILDHEAFFEIVQYINWMHYHIKGHWKNYKKRRSELIKKFEYNKMEILLRRHFCNDIKNLILTFLY